MNKAIENIKRQVTDPVAAQVEDLESEQFFEAARGEFTYFIEAKIQSHQHKRAGKHGVGELGDLVA